ncbi:hypothetical protein C8J57DRAFT_1718726 [Mycena rebaudengoi]|nr:hypothetical protein C8J57DRAFT_1718726 [Mycena rebaudengoi]
MAPGGICCDWVANPADKTELITYFKTIKEKIGQGGSWDETCLEMAAAHMRSLGPPLKGAPKNMKSVRSVWNGMKRVHDALVLVVQKRYPGASGWTYDQEHGFSVCDDNRDAWKEFIKHHAIFKPFANKGWKFFDDFKEIIPGRARGTNVFNPAVTAVAPSQDFDDASQLSNDASQLSNGASQLSQESTPQPRLPESSNRSQYFPENGFDDFDFPESLLNNSQSQPFTDWSQTQFGSTQPLTQLRLQPFRFPSSGGVKRAASDEFETPWTAKRGKTTGADALLAIGGSVDRISPTKQIEHARQLAIDDQEAGILSSRERALLNLIFTKDNKAADAYVAEKTLEGRSALAEILIERF